MTKKLLLNNKFYKKQAILSIKENFSEFAEITIRETGDTFEVEIEKKSNVEESLEEIAGEFANHCLAESK